MVYVKDIMELDYFKNNNLELVGGVNGLNRVVTRPNIAQLMNFHEWMAGGEFLLVNGVGLELDKLENMLTLIKNAETGKAACIAFEISKKYIPKVPRQAIELADEIKLPIFTLPWDVPFGEILNTVYDYIVRKQLEETTIVDLMRNILFVDVNPGYILQQADFYGYNLRIPHCSVIISCQNVNKQKDVYSFIKKYMVESVSIQEKPMIMDHNRDLVIFYPQSQKKSIYKFMNEMLDTVNSLIRNVEIFIAIGNYYDDLFKYRSSYDEARQALRFLKIKKEKNIMFFNDLGLLRLIDGADNGEKTRNYITEWLKPLTDYADNNHIDLVETLDKFQEANFNVARASQLLFIHRNTLLQRLDKIYSLMDIDIDDYNIRREIMNVMYLKKFYMYK